MASSTLDVSASCLRAKRTALVATSDRSRRCASATSPRLMSFSGGVVELMITLDGGASALCTRAVSNQTGAGSGPAQLAGPPTAPGSTSPLDGTGGQTA